LKKEALEYSLIENLQRKDVDPLDVAKALKKLADMMGGTSRKFAATVAARIGLKERMIWNYLSLINLTPEVQEMVSEDKLGVKLASQKLSFLINRCRNGLFTRT
jgi:ParB family chromosome partitioning protein